MLVLQIDMEDGVVEDLVSVGGSLNSLSDAAVAQKQPQRARNK